MLEENSISPDAIEYVVDERPLCSGMQFVLTDPAHPRLILKRGSHFLVLDQTGIIPGCNTLGYGYYRYDTRHISRWELTLDDVPPSLLAASVDDGYAGSFLYTNTETASLPQQTLMIQRDIVLSDLLWENFTIHNYHNQIAKFDLKFTFQSDFADMFEVRGLNRPERGKHMLPLKDKQGKSLFLAYRGVDNILVETEIKFVGLVPNVLNASDGEAIFNIELAPHQVIDMQFCISSRWEGKVPDLVHNHNSYWAARNAADSEFKSWSDNGCQILTADKLLDLTISGAMRDLYILRQPTPRGIGMAAGVPWYSTLFGRDSAITAWQVLPFIPQIGKECVDVLAAYQGKKDNDFTEENPGRIIHELRLGELARSMQIPHSPYYGSIDSTQLWLYLLCQYVDWSGDIETVERLWPNVESALNWLEGNLDSGYLAYQCRSPQGLPNQGWKDSNDCVMYDSGVLAKGPIALCEPQGYLYTCWLEIARLADSMGKFDLARHLSFLAGQLKQRFQNDFWMENDQFVALGLDGDGRQINVISSNPGHLLFTGILDKQKAELVASRLLSPELYSGWGVRTLSNQAKAYNPMSYHNGTVWPHDNAIIAQGMRKIGRVDGVHQILQSLLQVTKAEPEFRLPELICGFERHQADKPIDYPVACSPQAWASGTIFQLLTACLNLQADAANKTLRIVDPQLPSWLPEVSIKGLKVGAASLDLGFTHIGGMTACRVINKSGTVKVIMES